DNKEMIAISAIEREGRELVLRGKIFGTMPMTARVRPEEARQALKLLSWRTGRFLLSLPFRRRGGVMQDEFVPPERVGFVGLGNMGAPMAHHLAVAGYRVVATDADPAALERFCNTVQCERAASLRELGRTCGLVIPMLPDGRAVQQVLLGNEGIAPHLAPGSVVLDMSSVAPVDTRELAAKLAASSICLV